VKLAFHQLPSFFERLLPLLVAPAALLLGQGQAKAILNYHIFESAGDVIMQTSGSLDFTGLSPVVNSSECNLDGAILSAYAVLCTGNDVGYRPFYLISGPTFFNGTVSAYPASSASGMHTSLVGNRSIFFIDSAYTSATPIVSSATFNGQTLASLGFTTTGLIGTWSLVGTSETINVILGNPPAAAVPGPLPLFGAAAAFGWSRRLRKRIAAPLSTPPQA